LALREDAGAVFTLSRYWRQLLQAVRHGRELNDSFAKVRDQLGITNKFVLNWLDMLCFLLQGLPADGTLNAVGRYYAHAVSVQLMGRRFIHAASLYIIVC
jgi:hypothetical protein